MKHCLKSDTLLASSRVNSAPIHTWHSSADSSTILEKRSTKKWAAHDVLSKEILENTASHGKSPTLRGLTTTPFPKKQSEAHIVQAADAILQVAPAHAESVERYLTKIKDLQETAFSFPVYEKHLLSTPAVNSRPRRFRQSR